MSLLELFCDVDDFWLDFEPQWKASRLVAGKQRERTGQLCPSARDDDFDPFSPIALSNIQGVRHGTCPGVSDEGISSAGRVIRALWHSSRR